MQKSTYFDPWIFGVLNFESSRQSSLVWGRLFPLLSSVADPPSLSQMGAGFDGDEIDLTFGTKHYS